MNISVPSRFACLNIEDDEPLVNSKVGDKKRPEKSQVDKKVNKDNKKGNNGNNKQTNGSKKDKKVNKRMQKQWEEWKEKDDKFVNGNYEQDLENALLLSKIHFEENKGKPDDKIPEAKKGDKKKKNKVMSLTQFLANNEEQKEVVVEEKIIEPNEKYFEDLQLETQKELSNIKQKEQRKQREKQREAVIEDIISSAQYQEKLEIERKKNKKLELELQKSKDEISNVKLRNQTLCTMLSTGEMKEKADVLLELERLNTIKNELTEEVTRLHGLLEQERSKVASLTDNKHKDKKHKKHA